MALERTPQTTATGQLLHTVCILIHIFYNGINSSVLLPFGTCNRFEVKRGIRQGCPVSPLLFIMAAEILAIMIKDCKEINQLNVMGCPLVISQLADDTTLFLKNAAQITKALNVISSFSQASGLYLNVSKCELLAIHDNPLTHIEGIPIKKEVKYLGITVSKEPEVRVKANFEEIFKKSKSILNIWLQRDLSIFGRVLLAKMENLSRIIYPAYSLHIPDNIIKIINQNNFNFIWKNKHHYIRKNNVIKSLEDGGLNAIDFDPMNGSLKLKWLQTFIKQVDNIWFNLPRCIFLSFGGVEILLKCDFEINKLPVKLSKFHQQVLLYWKLIFKHNFSPHNTPIWNNQYLLIKRKSFYWKEWADQGIWSIRHLIDNRGNILDLIAFNNKYNLNCTQDKYNKVIKAIPRAILINIKGSLYYQRMIPHLQDCTFLSDKCSKNQFSRSILTKACFPSSLKRRYLLERYLNASSDAKKIRCYFLKFPISPKAKEVHFKTMNEIYPCKELLYLKFGLDTNVCTFCENDMESQEHLFFSCSVSSSFWKAFCQWCLKDNPSLSQLNYENIQFGIMLKDSRMEFMLNNLIIMAKYYIHKCKFRNLTPHLSVFMKELSILCDSLKYINMKLSQELYQILINLLSTTPENVNECVE